MSHYGVWFECALASFNQLAVICDVQVVVRVVTMLDFSPALQHVIIQATQLYRQHSYLLQYFSGILWIE